jgi:ubiquitin C-terminal hydrolase
MKIDGFFVDKGRKGLVNFGATCYLNTAIQCLSYCMDFLHYVLSSKYEKHAQAHGRTLEEANLMAELREILVELWLKSNNISPKKFISCVRRVMPEIEILEQNDINEFLSLFLDKLNRAVCYDVKTQKCKQVKKAGHASTRYDQQRFKMDLSWYEKTGKEYSDLLDLFHGQMITQIICGHCKHISHNYEIYSSIMVSIDNSCETLEACLKEHFKDETLNTDTKWTCDECKHTVHSVKTHKLWRYPRILIVTLKRFTVTFDNNIYDLKKNYKEVRIPNEVYLEEFGISKRPCSYTLQSIACHIGSFHGGHYYAYCKHPDKKWYKVDDLNVQEVDHPDDRHAYLAFYALRAEND